MLDNSAKQIVSDTRKAHLYKPGNTPHGGSPLGTLLPTATRMAADSKPGPKVSRSALAEAASETTDDSQA
jgi:hypothetical protein